MKIKLSKQFQKHYKKVPKKVQTQFKERLVLLMGDVRHPLLRVHTLKGTESEFFSMNVTGDYRALFKLEAETIAFYKIGTHSELYS